MDPLPVVVISGNQTSPLASAVMGPTVSVPLGNGNDVKLPAVVHSPIPPGSLLSSAEYINAITLPAVTILLLILKPEGCWKYKRVDANSEKRPAGVILPIPTSPESVFPRTRCSHPDLRDPGKIRVGDGAGSADRRHSELLDFARRRNLTNRPRLIICKPKIPVCTSRDIFPPVQGIWERVRGDRPRRGD